MPPLESQADLLRRIAEALERAVPATPAKPDFEAAEAFIWRADGGTLAPVPRVNRVDLSLLRGIERVRDLLVENTQRFARGLPANNALLWGARGMGKSSLVKAAHAAINREGDVAGRLKLVEIHREDIEGLPALMGLMRDAPYRFIVFCDDLSFDAGDTSYKSLKAALEGGIEGRPANVLFYATSNRRHLMPREMMDNERSTAINPGEAVEEKVSLSDRFGLWLGFHHCSQDDYLAMVHGYAKHFRLEAPAAQLETKRSNGRRRAARAPAGRRGSSSRISPGGLGGRSRRRAIHRTDVEGVAKTASTAHDMRYFRVLFAALAAWPAAAATVGERHLVAHEASAALRNASHKRRTPDHDLVSGLASSGRSAARRRPSRQAVVHVRLRGGERGFRGRPPAPGDPAVAWIRRHSADHGMVRNSFGATWLCRDRRRPPRQQRTRPDDRRRRRSLLGAAGRP